MAVQSGYYIIAGWKSISELYHNGSRVDLLPTQTDMKNGRRWQRPASTADVVTPAKLVDSVTGQRFAYGGLTFSWPMQGLSPNMVSYLQSTYFPSSGSTFFTRAWSSKLTVQTFNRATGSWETYWTYGRFANLASDAEPALGGYNNLTIQFTAYREATSGPDLEATVTVPSTLYEGETYSFNSYFTNVGDTATYNDSVMTFDIPIDFEFSNITSVLDVVYGYSDDGGLTYSPSLPVDPTTVTNVRITYADPIPANSTAGAVVLYVTSTAISASTDWTVTLTTVGDADTANDTIVTTLEVLAWLPLALTNLKLWLDSSVGLWQDEIGTTPANTTGDLVQRWDDQSGNDYNVLGLTGGDNPAIDQTPDGNPGTFRPAGTGGSLYDYIEFDASTMYRTDDLSIPSSQSTVIIIYDATHDDTWGTVEGLAQLTGVNESSSVYLAHIDDNQSPTDYRDSTAISDSGTTDNWDRFTTSISGLQSAYFVNRTGAVGRRYYLNGTLTGTTYGGTNYPIIRAWIGGSWGLYSTAPSAYSVPSFAGKMYEVIWYTDELSVDELSRVTAYITNKYGL